MRHLLRLLLSLCVAACTTTGSPDDAGTTPPGGDASVPDAAHAPDAHAAPDAGRADASVPDAALPPDASAPPDAGGADASRPVDAGPGVDAAPPPDASTTGNDAAIPDSGFPDADTPDAAPRMVEVAVTGEVLLANNYPSHLHALLSANLSAGSALARLRLHARFCSDEACANPVALVPADVSGADGEGYYVFSTANTSGTGLAKAFTIPRAPAGSWWVQLVGDTQASALAGRPACTSTADCPGDLDVIQTSSFQVSPNPDGTGTNPPALALPVTVVEGGGDVALPGTVYLGHFVLDETPLRAPAPADPGRLLVALSNQADTFRNQVVVVDLAPAPAVGDSYVLQKNGADLPGDICGVVRGATVLYAIAIDVDGANIFALDPTTGLQLGDEPVVTIPPGDPQDAETYPWPCRGVAVTVGGTEHLYLVQFKGAGSLDTSRPSPLYHVDVVARTHSAPFGAYTDQAWRAIVANGAGTRLFVLEQSWSKDSRDQGVLENRVLALDLDGTGAPGTPAVMLTGTTSDDTCESTLQWPSGLAMFTLNGAERLLVGHDEGVAVVEPSTLTVVDEVDLRTFGRVFTQLSASANRLYALPQCKAYGDQGDFTLPYGAGTENADKYLVAVLADVGGALATPELGIDIDGNGTDDHGVDLDYFHVKRHLRSYSTTMPIPPVVFTGPQMTVGASMLFVRGSGIQGNGSNVVSASGLGQAQDVSFHDLTTGRGLIFNDYQPFWHGLSAEGGTGSAIWGFDVWPGQPSSVGWVEYLP
ncbi:MAG: hypothetical protein AB2A00_07260 [Myxococcota bacterium]